MRLWHSGLPVDTGNKRDAGSRFDATINDVPITYYLRVSPLLSDVPGAARSFTDVFVDSKSGCPDRAFKPLGTWTVTIPLCGAGACRVAILVIRLTRRVRAAPLSSP